MEDVLGVMKDVLGVVEEGAVNLEERETGTRPKSQSVGITNKGENKKSKSVSKPGDDIHGEGEGDDGVRGQHLHQHWQKITSTNFTELKTGQEAGHKNTGSCNFIANILLRTDKDKSVGVQSLVRKFEELGLHQDDQKLKLNLVPAKKFYFGGIMG